MAQTHIQNWNEAIAEAEKIEDQTTRNLVDLMMVALLTQEARTRVGPSAPFDALFFLRMVTSVFENKELLEEALSGKPFKHSWDDENGE